MNLPLECHVRLWGEDAGTIAEMKNLLNNDIGFQKLR